MDYLLYIMSGAGIYAIIAIGYAVPVGYTGLVNFGQVGMLAVGAYTAAILNSHGAPFAFAVLAAVLASALAGFLLGIPARRIKNDYYALITLGFVFVMNSVILNWTSVTGGPFGISGIARPEAFRTAEAFLFLVVVTAALLFLVVQRVVNGPFGRALEAVRDDEEVAASLGKSVPKLKLIAMTLSGAVSGVGGAYFAYYVQFINAQVFWLDFVVVLIAALVVGGLASLRGAVLGTVLLFLVHEPLRFLPLPGEYLGPLRLMIWSLLLLGFVIFRPKGLVGRAQLDA